MICGRHRSREFARLRLRMLFLLVVVSALGGCFDTHYQVFSREDGVEVLGLEGRYNTLESMCETSKPCTNRPRGTLTISRTQRGNDYRFRCERCDIAARTFPANSQISLACIGASVKITNSRLPLGGTFLMPVLRVRRMMIWSAL